MGLKKILLVDDEPNLLKLVKRRLESVSFDVIVASDGEEAIKKIQQDPPDLIILDVMLPKLNGYEVCRRLRSNSLYENIPVIMFTALATDSDERMGLECGANAYIRKPFRAQELIEKIQELLLPPKIV